MKALSLKQPWANLVAEGFKTIETRKWNTKYRGDLLICSSKAFDAWNSRLTIEYGISDAPYGMALCVVDLYDCKPMTEEDIEKACCSVYPKAHSFFLRNIRPIRPFPVKGQLNIFNLDVKPEEIVYL
jgi:hypothetical protein